jgi:RNA polymerase sigma-70 factor (ECF subfamily)
MLEVVTGHDDASALERERALVARAQAGDRAAIGELLTRYGPGLYRSVLLPRLGSEAAAKDALAECYARVVERIDRFTWQNVGFYPWLRTVALRVAIDQLRARKRLVLWEAQDVEREVDACSTSTPVDQRVSDRRDRETARAKVEDALSRIHPRYARALRLRVLEERTREEVAREMEVTPATFDVLLHRAIAALKKAVIAADGDTNDAPAAAVLPRYDRAMRPSSNLAVRSAETMGTHSQAKEEAGDAES